MITKEGIELTREQEDAIELIRNFWNQWNTCRDIYKRKRVLAIAGFAGTGKTTMVCEAIKRLKLEEYTRFVAFTGKAAMVLMQKGVKTAVTIHNTFYNLKEVLCENGKLKLGFEEKQSVDSDIKLIVIDEASMVSENMLEDILKHNIPIIMVGDTFQLPPILAKGDLENIYMKSPDITLEEIHRQAELNPILRFSKIVRQYKEYGNGVRREFNFNNDVLYSHPDIFEEKNVKYMSGVQFLGNFKRVYTDEYQILCFTNAKRKLCNDLVRRSMEIVDTFSFENKLPVAGDKIICLKNNNQRKVEGIGLLNGMMGYATNVVVDDMKLNGKSTVSMDFTADLNSLFYGNLPCDISFFQEVKENIIDKDVLVCNFDFGYAITCHKSQGSEYDKVIVIDDYSGWGSDKSLKYRRWLYTAITRAKKELIIVRNLKEEDIRTVISRFDKLK